MQKHLRLIASIIFFSLTGCASHTGVSSQNILFTSSPSGAKVYIDGKLIGTSPVAASLPFRRQYREIYDKKKELQKGDITEEEFKDFKNCTFKILYKKDNFDLHEFYITPQKMLPNHENKSTCHFKYIVYFPPIAVLMPILIVPWTIDVLNNYCHGFKAEYNIKLVEKGSRGINGSRYSGYNLG
ncbi:PEGA domain-containing protein [Rickettsiales bacterium]|nr:PEGA domain-containing protein [Rickettsiales bacterium]